MKKHLLYLAIFTCMFGCKQKTASSQKVTTPASVKTGPVGGGCEGCEAIYETPIPFEQLSYTDTLPHFNDGGPRLMVEGVIYKADGKTPAPGVVLYVYHTNLQGIYESRATDSGWAKRHGYRRGWIKTDEEGRYRFYTLKPAPYPGRKTAAHIHPVIKEPGLNEYYIDEFVFDDDPLLGKNERSKMENRGGNGILKTTMQNGMLVAKRDIVLGMNIPDYPANKK